jgi:hypothetical protein
MELVELPRLLLFLPLVSPPRFLPWCFPVSPRYGYYHVLSESYPDAVDSCVAATCGLELLLPLPFPLFGTKTFVQSMPRVTSDPSGRVTLFRFSRTFLTPSSTIWSTFLFLFSSVTTAVFRNGSQPPPSIELFARILLVLCCSVTSSGVRRVIPLDVPGDGSRISSAI